MTITDRMAAWRRERRVLQRVSRAAWRLEQAERERSWALASARAEGVPIRKLAAAAGLSPARVHQITAGADLDGLDAALGELRAAGWPAPEDPGGDDDAELDGRDLICDRLLDEVGWLPQCVGVSINPVGTVSSTVPGVTAPTPTPPTPPAAFWPRSRPCESAPDFRQSPSGDKTDAGHRR